MKYTKVWTFLKWARKEWRFIDVKILGTIKEKKMDGRRKHRKRNRRKKEHKDHKRVK